VTPNQCESCKGSISSTDRAVKR